MRPAVSRAAWRQRRSRRTNGRQPAAILVLSLGSRVFSIPISGAIEADELPTVTALAERGKQHISMTGRANRDRQESTHLGRAPQLS